MKQYDSEMAAKLCEVAQGWIRPKERPKLYELAHSTPAGGVVVEIGSWRGRSTIILACASKNANKPGVFAVDPFGKPEKMVVKPEYNLWQQQNVYDTYEDFLKNIQVAGMSDVVTPIRGMSEDAVEVYREKYNHPIRFLFIDGCHQREYVQKDWDLWSPFVMRGGAVAFHDAWSRIGKTGKCSR
jgi:predicted O-methyltransferase YrrM